MIDNSYSYLVGPLVSFGALLVIILICRWVFSTSHRDARATSRETVRSKALASRRADYGLLVAIASVRTRDDAEMLRTVLLGAGIRCTVVEDRDGADVLVFRRDALRAKELVSS